MSPSLPTLRIGSIGQHVQTLQSALNLWPKSITAKLDPDGVFGPKTNAKVMEYQRGNSLVADGIVGPLTLGVLQPLLDQLLGTIASPPGGTPPADPHWGVDSYAPAYRPDDKPGDSLFDRVREIKKPAFWGRYIRCPNPDDKNVLTDQEAQHLLNNGCAILPIYNRTVYQQRKEALNNRRKGTFADGFSDAQDAVAAATGLRIRKGVWIYADIEPSWPNVTTDWILGWWCRMLTSDYRPGLYGTPQSIYVKACNLIKSSRAPVHMAIGPYARWFSSPAIEQLSYIWSSRPRRGSFKDPPAPWEPYAPSGHAADVKVWQYCENHRVGGKPVDADYAKDEAIAGMWPPSKSS